MQTLIACSADRPEVDTYSEVSIWNPWENKYVDVMIRVIREATEEEYLKFCKDLKFEVRNNLLPTRPYYFEIEVLD